MKLTKEQLLQIKAFIEKRGFTHIDVQMEILDHVASAVEDRMHENPTLSFENALSETHRSFGVMGFSVIADGVVAALSKKYRQIFWKNFAAAFGLKYILLIFVLLFAIYKLQTIVTNDIQLTSILIFCLLFLSFLTTVFGLRARKFKKLMSYRIASTYLPIAGVFLTCLNVYIDKVESGTIIGLNTNYALVSIILTLFMVYFYAGIVTGKKGIEDSRVLMEKYNLVYA